MLHHGADGPQERHRGSPLHSRRLVVPRQRRRAGRVVSPGCGWAAVTHNEEGEQNNVRAAGGERPAMGKLRRGEASSNPRWTGPSCQPLGAVSNVAHVEVALDIVRDGRIKPGLVLDKSKLNRDRVLVVWTSSNDWSGAGGFWYGNISFDFDWKTLVKGLNYYWVEDVGYGITACRILITDQDHGDKPDKLERYDPTLRNGPRWHDTSSDQHYWNGTCCLEIMVERELPLSEAISVDFVVHSRKGCCNDYRTCPDIRASSEKGGAKLLASLAGRYLSGKQIKLTENLGELPVCPLNSGGR